MSENLDVKPETIIKIPDYVLKEIGEAEEVSLALNRRPADAEPYYCGVLPDADTRVDGSEGFPNYGQISRPNARLLLVE